MLIADHNLPQNAWNLGAIIETRTDKHGLVRSAEIKTATTMLDRLLRNCVHSVQLRKFNSAMYGFVSCLTYSTRHLHFFY